MFITASGGTANHAAPRYLWYTTRPIVDINVNERATSTPRAPFNSLIGLALLLHPGKG